MSEIKSGDLVHVKEYFENAKFVPGGIHGIVVDVELGIEEHIWKGPIIQVLTANGFLYYYSANNLKPLEGA
jgi:hypothetical protein